MSHSDKRTPHTDALETLGTIHTHDEFRDAIHLAVEPVVAGEDLAVGQRITYVNGKAYALRSGEEAIGIVDPFLSQRVKAGEKFWLVVLPRMIQSLRHVWSHPAFPDEAAVEFLKKAQATAEDDVIPELVALTPEESAYNWIRNYADELSTNPDDEYGGVVTAEELIDMGWSNYETGKAGGSSWGDYLNKGGLFEGVSVADEFWEQLGILKGVSIESEHRNNFFTCAC